MLINSGKILEKAIFWFVFLNKETLFETLRIIETHLILHHMMSDVIIFFSILIINCLNVNSMQMGYRYMCTTLN